MPALTKSNLNLNPNPSLDLAVNLTSNLNQNCNYNSPSQAINKGFGALPIVRHKLDKFQTELGVFLRHLNQNESEEHNKNLLSDLIKNINYNPDHYINTKGRNDLVIHAGKDSNSPVAVMIEAKSLANKAEMPTKEKINSKALQELVLYFLRERLISKNLSLKHLIVTNGLEWFVFEAQVFEKCFAQNKSLVKEFQDFEAKILSGTETSFFYKEIAQKYIAQSEAELNFTHFDLSHYQTDLNSSNLESTPKIRSLYKFLSPTNLLKLPFGNDSNTLDKGFYTELLHIMGLEEIKTGGKKLIQRKASPNRSPGSLLENTIAQIEQQDKLHRVPALSSYGQDKPSQLFNLALELCITWINRILFLKLLEAQLIKYNPKNELKNGFLNSTVIGDFDELNNLFFGVLAKLPQDRSPENQQKYGLIPYLNSSLFEPTELEQILFSINNLANKAEMQVAPNTVLKDNQAKKIQGKTLGLEYLLQFLGSFAFGSSSGDEVLEADTTLINSAVLGLIFEKINGYKDGSFFTPGFITMYMAREAVRQAVIQKFNKWYDQDIEDIAELKNFISSPLNPVGSPYKKEVLKEYNLLINSLKIVDPAVGSGHFLVSVLNEIIALKSELNILADQDFNLLSKVKVEILNDELRVFYTQTGENFEYNPENLESELIQAALFTEKQTLIEKTLFGVDINPNSVKICRLRLWIELLKNTHYKAQSEAFSSSTSADTSQKGNFLAQQNFSTSKTRQLQTLPNIDINIKCGNSLISRFGLETDIKQVLQSKKWSIEGYKLAVSAYQNARSKEEKREFENLINTIKADFKTYISEQDPLYGEKSKLESELYDQQMSVFGLSQKEELAKKDRQDKLKIKLNLINSQIAEIKTSKIYQNAFEWRFEFPEVLDDDGNFVGFDVVIGNPPYIMEYENKSAFNGLKNKIGYQGKTDIWHIFACQAVSLVKLNGFVSFIAKNQWVESQSASKMREFLYKNTQIRTLIDFGSNMIFDEASVQTMIFVIQKNKSKNHQIDYTKLQTSFDAKIISEIIHKNLKIEGVKKLIKTLPADFDPNANISFSNPSLDILFDKIESVKNFDFDEKTEIIQGIIGGPDKAFLINKQELAGFTAKEREYLKIFHTHTDKYFTPDTDKYLFYLSKNNFDVSKIDEFPNILNKLLPFKTHLQNRREVLSKSISWVNLWWPRNEDFFEAGAKLVWAKRTENAKFTFTKDPFYGSANLFFIKTDRINLKFITGVLNSSLFYFYMHQKLKHTGDLLQIDKNQFLKIPIYNPTLDTPEKETIAAQIEILVTRILAIKSEVVGSTPSATLPPLDQGNLDALQLEIDALVFDLYGLDAAEQALVLGV